MLQEQRQRWIVLAVCLLVAVCGANSLHAAAAKKPTCKPGVDKNFTWQRGGVNEARKLEKPILLYIYDVQDGKASDPVKQVQQEIFANSGVRQAFSDFTPVMQSMQSTSWPAVYTAQAKNGVALFVMTCDANPVAVFTHKNLPKAVKDAKAGTEDYPMLVGAADAARKSNPKALAAMKKNPPKDYISPEQLAAQREAAQQPPEPEPKGNETAGLLEETAKKDPKTADVKKKPEEVVGAKKKPLDENE